MCEGVVAFECCISVAMSEQSATAEMRAEIEDTRDEKRDIGDEGGKRKSQFGDDAESKKPKKAEIEDTRGEKRDSGVEGGKRESQFGDDAESKKPKNVVWFGHDGTEPGDYVPILARRPEGETDIAKLPQARSRSGVGQLVDGNDLQDPNKKQWRTPRIWRDGAWWVWRDETWFKLCGIQDEKERWRLMSRKF